MYSKNIVIYRTHKFHYLLCSLEIEKRLGVVKVVYSVTLKNFPTITESMKLENNRTIIRCKCMNKNLDSGY